MKGGINYIIADKLILNKYRVVDLLQESENCIVYLAEHIILCQSRVLKCLYKTSPAVEVFLREVKFLKNLNNKSIPILYDFEEDGEFYYIVEEYIEGKSFKEYFLNLADKKEHLHNIISEFIELAELFVYLHNQNPYPILYLDLKPEHIVRGNKGIYLLDFGGAMEKKESSIEGCCMGTSGFASPELMRGEKLDERTDIYSLGALFFWCLTQKTVKCTMSREEIYEMLADYPLEIRKIIAKCLDENIEYRFVSVSEFADRLKLFNTNCNKEKSSFIIAVVGSQPRVGVTHFCVALVNYLNMSHRKCLYEEKTDSAFLNGMCENTDFFTEKQGIVYAKNFYGLPKYGQAVVMENLDYEIIIRDYGAITKTVVSDLKKADICIGIGGVKNWEIGYTRNLYNRIMEMGLIDKAVFVLQGVGKNSSREDIFFMPYSINPFKNNSELKHFFENLLKKCMLKNKWGGNYIEKCKKNKKFGGNDRNNGKCRSRRSNSSFHYDGRFSFIERTQKDSFD